MAYSTPLSFTLRDKLTDPFFPQPKTPARLHHEPATARNKSLTIFHKFSELPKELQHKVWSAAFFNSPALHDWIKVDWQSPAAAEAYYFGGEDPKTDFWNWSSIGPFPKSIGLRTADRRLHLLISFDSGIPALLQACRSSRKTALKEFKRVLSKTGFAINLTALQTNTAVFEALLQDMKKAHALYPSYNINHSLVNLHHYSSISTQHQDASTSAKKATMTSLTSFPLFGELPKELQLMIWSTAFYNSPGLHDWARLDWSSFDESAGSYFGKDKIEFWKYPHKVTRICWDEIPSFKFAYLGTERESEDGRLRCTSLTRDCPWNQGLWPYFTLAERVAWLLWSAFKLGDTTAQNIPVPA